MSSPCVCVCDLAPVAMVELDGDDIRVSSRGKLAERDIVQVSILYSIIRFAFFFTLNTVSFLMVGVSGKKTDGFMKYLTTIRILMFKQQRFHTPSLPYLD